MTKFTDIKARLAAITPGPWVTACGGYSVYVDDERCIGIAYNGMNKYHRTPQVVADMAFIASAPADLAWAVRRIEELEAVLLSCLNGMNSDNPVWKRAAKLLEGE